MNAQLKKVTPLSVQTAANYRLNCLHLDHSVSQVDLLNKKIRDQIAKDMEAGGAIPARVFVTFDTEADQRTCLDIMSCGSLFAFFDASMPAWLMKWLVKFNLKSPEQQELHDFKMFKNNVLMITEAPEPEDVLWENLNVEPIDVFKLSCLSNFIALLCVGAAAAIIVGLSISFVLIYTRAHMQARARTRTRTHTHTLTRCLAF